MLKVGFQNLNYLFIKCIIIIIIIIIIIFVIIIIETYIVRKKKLQRNCYDRCYYFRNGD